MTKFIYKSDLVISNFESYKCPYCNDTFTITHDNSSQIRINEHFNHHSVGFDKGINIETGGNYFVLNGDEKHNSAFDVILLRCPNSNCGKTTIYLNSFGDYFPNYRGQFLPNANITAIPEYVPNNIIKDINEAELILDLSHNASATLSRRSLQAMIRDFHNIEERTLHKEIEELRNQALITIDEFDVLMALKSIGNYGAHPNEDDVTNLIIDVEYDEAKDLILLIHHFINIWYVTREETKLLFSRVSSSPKNK